jgi:hypothetical protein
MLAVPLPPTPMHPTEIRSLGAFCPPFPRVAGDTRAGKLADPTIAEDAAFINARRSILLKPDIGKLLRKPSWCLFISDNE